MLCPFQTRPSFTILLRCWDGLGQSACLDSSTSLLLIGLLRLRLVLFFVYELMLISCFSSDSVTCFLEIYRYILLSLLLTISSRLYHSSPILVCLLTFNLCFMDGHTPVSAQGFDPAPSTVPISSIGASVGASSPTDPPPQPSPMVPPSTISGLDRPSSPAGLLRPPSPDGLLRPSSPDGFLRPSAPPGPHPPNGLIPQRLPLIVQVPSPDGVPPPSFSSVTLQSPDLSTDPLHWFD